MSDNLPPGTVTIDDSATTIAGAIKYVECGFCGAVAGDNCNNRPWFGFNMHEHTKPGRRLAPNFAHFMRRVEYTLGVGLYWPAVVIDSNNIDDLLGAP